MHLLNCCRDDSDGSLRIFLEKDVDRLPPYAILSHRWRAGEVMFRDCDGVPNLSAKPEIKDKLGFKKLEWTCSQALADGFSYVWIDTCCIDKSSSAELSEAINSMYRWYELSQRCYAYLDDVSSSEDPRAEGSQFRNGVWFTRGWTLQELIAPTEVVFFSADWQEIGTKVDLADIIALITRVDSHILRDGMYAHETSVAQKMSWAAGRQTTREEDRAYSLLGLFKVHMPPMYGEGSRAFRRLQEEIMRASTDHTIFAWHGAVMSSGMLAESPDQFLSPVYHPVNYEEYAEAFGMSQPKPDFTMTNFGLYIQLPIAPIRQYPGYYYGFLACSTTNKKEVDLGNVAENIQEWAIIYLSRRPGSRMPRFTRTSFRGCWIGNGRATDQEFDIDMTPMFLLPYEDIWPLSWRQPIEEPKLPSQIGHIDPESTVTFILAKGHQNIHVVEACPANYFTAQNEISLSTLPGGWAMKSELGGRVFPPCTLPWIAERIQIERLSFSRKTFGDGRRMSTLIVNNGMRGGRMLIVLAMGKGFWLLFLLKAREDLDANAYREYLFDSAESDPTLRLNLDLADSGFVALAVPFNKESNSYAQLGTYLVQIERKFPLGYTNLAFRMTVGLRAFEKSNKTYDIPSDSRVLNVASRISVGNLSFN